MADERYDDRTAAILMRSGLSPMEKDARIREGQFPSNTAGIPNLLVREMPELQGKNTRGFVLGSNVIKEEMANRGMQPNIFVAPNATHDTIAHEAEHLLARQNAGFAQMPREKFMEMLDGSFLQKEKKVQGFLNGLTKSAPYLKEKYGIDNAYMDPEFIKKDGHVGLYEIFATLAGTEAAKNVDLTKDPELRKTLFKDKDVREAYNAVTGLRQTRLDPRDLPPYTRQPEKEAEPSGAVDRIKKLLGFANGGAIPGAGNTKLI